MDFDFVMPLSDADSPRPLTPHDFDDTPIDYHSASAASPSSLHLLSSDVPEFNYRSNQGSQSPQPEDIGSTTYHPVMNGRL
jgi:hypothetical protein